MSKLIQVTTYLVISRLVPLFHFISILKQLSFAHIDADAELILLQTLTQLQHVQLMAPRVDRVGDKNTHVPTI